MSLEGNICLERREFENGLSSYIDEGVVMMNCVNIIPELSAI